MTNLMKFVIFITTFKCFQFLEPIWVKSAMQVARENFDKPVILILDATNKVEEKNRYLVPDQCNDGVKYLMAGIETNWSVVTGDLRYQKPEDKLIHFTLGLTKAHQIIAILNETAAMDITIFEKTLLLWREHIIWFGRAKILLVVETRESLAVKIAKNVFQELWKQVKAVNVALLVSLQNVTTFLSWKPYAENCSVDPYIAGYWKNESNSSISIFPIHNFNNLKQCKLLAVPVVLEPFVFPPDENNVYKDGIEIEIFLMLSKHLNFSYGYQNVPNGQNPWVVRINGTSAGLLGVLDRREADISLSGIRINLERSEICDHVDTYYGDDFSWIGPTAQRTARWKAIFLVFSLKIWSYILITLIGSLVFLTFIYTFVVGTPFKQSSTSAFIVIWSITLGTSIPSKYLTNLLIIRGFLAIFLFYVLTINSLYTSNLFKVLSLGLKQENINTAQDGLEAGLTASIFPSNFMEIQIGLPNFFKYGTANNLILWSENYLDCLRRAAKQGDCFALYPTFGGKYFINMLFTSKSGRRYVRIFAERYKAYEPVLCMPKHHPLLPLFRSKIRSLVESGWILKQIEDILDSGLKKRALLSEVSDFDNKEVRTVLSVEQILGGILVAGFFFMFALVTFLFEIFFNRNHGRSMRNNNRAIFNMFLNQ